MTTQRFASDHDGKKIYIGSSVRYENKIFLVEDMGSLSWNRHQYLTLVHPTNKNKKMEFVPSTDVYVTYKKTRLKTVKGK